MRGETVTPDPAEGHALHGRKPGDGDCWNVIGVSGDGTCPELASFIHCRNCPVFAAAARSFFDRPAPEGYLADWSGWLAKGGRGDSVREGDLHENALPGDVAKESVVIFRLGPEWLAVRTVAVTEVAPLRPIHRVPHRTNEVFLGLVNLQGQLELCVSLHGLLGVTPTSSAGRLVVLRDHNRAESWAFLADQVLGVEHVPRSRWHNVPSTLVNPTVAFSVAVLSWKELSIGLLDLERVFCALRGLKP